MYILIFLLALLVMVDHWHRYKLQTLLQYKNNHTFDIVLAIYHGGDHARRMIAKLQASKHRIIVVDINNTLQNTEDVENLYSLKVTETSQRPFNRISMLSRAYNEGVKHTEGDFLLFIDDSLHINSMRMINTLANNLVEHQIMTIKPTKPHRDLQNGYAMFYDLYEDMRHDNENIFHSFYAIKKSTLELTGIHKEFYSSKEAFLEPVERKNISITHVDHKNNVRYVPMREGYKPMTRLFIERFVRNPDQIPFKRMLLFLAAFHLFYIYTIFNIQFLSIAFVLAIPLAFFALMRPHMNMHILNYILIPLYMIHFDCVLLVALFKRIKNRLFHNKQ